MAGQAQPQSGAISPCSEPGRRRRKRQSAGQVRVAGSVRFDYADLGAGREDDSDFAAPTGEIVGARDAAISVGVELDKAGAGGKVAVVVMLHVQNIDGGVVGDLCGRLRRNDAEAPIRYGNGANADLIFVVIRQLMPPLLPVVGIVTGEPRASAPADIDQIDFRQSYLLGDLAVLLLHQPVEYLVELGSVIAGLLEPLVVD